MDSTLMSVENSTQVLNREVSTEEISTEEISTEDTSTEVSVSDVSNEVCFQTLDKRTKMFFHRVPFFKPEMRKKMVTLILVWEKMIGSSDDMLFVVFSFIFSRYRLFQPIPNDPLSVLYTIRPKMPTVVNECTCRKNNNCYCECHAKKDEWMRLKQEWKQSDCKSAPRPKFPKEVNSCMCCFRCSICRHAVFRHNRKMAGWREMKKLK